MEDSKKLRISVEIFVDWLANQSPPWSACHTFMYGCLIAPDKKPGVCQIEFRKTWRQLFYKCVLKVTGPEVTNTCQDDYLCDRLKVGIDSAVHRVQAIWDANLSTEDWGFLLVDTKNAFNDINKL